MLGGSPSRRSPGSSSTEAFANLVLDGELRRSTLGEQDRRFVTQLVYGTTRMRRACDFLVERFIARDIDPDVRTLLRLGAYQLHFLSTPDHAAVDATVALAPHKARGFVNVVLRRVATAPVQWPSDGIRLSYPDWLVNQLVADLGSDDAIAMLERMNLEPAVHERPDGYIQDPGSQWVCDAVDAQPGDVVLDSCAAPGGKSTLIAGTGATVIAADRRPSRARLIVDNAAVYKDRACACARRRRNPLALPLGRVRSRAGRRSLLGTGRVCDAAPMLAGASTPRRSYGSPSSNGSCFAPAPKVSESVVN